MNEEHCLRTKKTARIILWVVIGCAVVALWGWQAYSASYHNSNQASQESSAEEHRDNEKEESFRQRFAHDPLAVLTLVLAAFTGLLWQSTHRLSVATNALVTGADDTAQRQLRAYVAVSIRSVGNFGSEHPAKAEIVYENFGLTPAHDLVVAMLIEIAPVGDELNIIVPPREHSDHVCTVFPRKPHISKHRGSRVFTSDEVEAVLSGTHNLYIAGAIIYTDAFGKERWMRFCYICDREALRKVRSDGQTISDAYFQKTKKNNDAT